MNAGDRFVIQAWRAGEGILQFDEGRVYCRPDLALDGPLDFRVAGRDSDGNVLAVPASYAFRGKDDKALTVFRFAPDRAEAGEYGSQCPYCGHAEQHCSDWHGHNCPSCGSN